MKKNLLKIWPKILAADKEYCSKDTRPAPLEYWFKTYLEIDIVAAPLMPYEKFMEHVSKLSADDPWREILEKHLNDNQWVEA